MFDLTKVVKQSCLKCRFVRLKIKESNDVLRARPSKAYVSKTLSEVEGLLKYRFIRLRTKKSNDVLRARLSKAYGEGSFNIHTKAAASCRREEKVPKAR